MPADINEIGSWASIIGLAITIVTFFLAANVNKKVNGILKTKNDNSYFNKMVKGVIEDLKGMRGIAEDGKSGILYATKQYSQLNKAIEVVNSSWDVLLQYENKISRRIKINIWKRKFKRIRNMYTGQTISNTNEVIAFLNEFITFLEKEQGNHE